MGILTSTICICVCVCSVATVEEDLRYMQQPARMYIGESINAFERGSLVMEHPGSSPLPIIGKPILYGGVHGTIGMSSFWQGFMEQKCQ